MEKSLQKINLLMNTNEEGCDIGNKLSDFEILQVLGQGTYGFVAKVKSKLNLKIYALKKYTISEMPKDQLKYALNESIFMKKLNHENVVKLYNDFKDNEGNIYMIMEYMDGGDLYTFINANMNLNLCVEEEKLWNIYEQCLRGLVYLHKKGLIHRDIKPANLLLNSKGEVKYSDFNVSAIINTDKARDFTNEKNKEENLINGMTQVGSGRYAAPEIQEDEFCQEYDLKVDVYSLGITFCTLAFFQMDFPNQEQMQKYNYSKELFNIISYMIIQDPSQRPSSLQIYNLFIKLYIEKYIYCTGFKSCIFSLLASPSIFKGFFNINIDFEKSKSPIPIAEKFYQILCEIYYLRQSNNMNNGQTYNKEGKSLNHLIYDLRKLLLENGSQIKDIGNNEINPIIIVTFLLKKLHEELNIYKGNLGKSKIIYKKIIRGENPKLEAYNCYKKFYVNNFKSIISDEFFGLIKTKSICKKCKNAAYSFKVLCYIPFNIKILAQNYENKENINLYEAFDCLNQNYIELDKKQYIQCENCKTSIEHIELKQFYNLSKNLVIIFDRGEHYTYNNFIDFPEIFTLDCNYVECFKNIKVNYTLISIISRFEVEQNSNKRTREIFRYFTRQGGNCYNDGQGQIFNLETIKKNGTIIALFYYSENGIPNFIEDINNGTNAGQMNMSNLILNNNNNNGNWNNNNINRQFSGDVNFNNINNNFNNNMNNIINNNMNNNMNNNYNNNPNTNQNINNNNFGNNNAFQNFQMNNSFNSQNNNNNQNFNNINNNSNGWQSNPPSNINNINNGLNNMNLNNMNNNNINNNFNRNFNNQMNLSGNQIMNQQNNNSNNNPNISMTQFNSRTGSNQQYNNNRNQMMFGQNPPNNPGNFNTSQVGKNHPGNFNRYNNPKGNNGNNQFN